MALLLCYNSLYFAQKHTEITINKIIKCLRFALLESSEEGEIGREEGELAMS